MKRKDRFIIFSQMPWQIAKAEKTGMFFLAVFSGICAVLQVYAVSGFINAALQSIGNSLFSPILLIKLFLLFLAVGGDWLAPRISSFLNEKAKIKMEQQYRPLMLEKCAGLKYKHVEQPESWDLIERVLKEPEKRWMDIYQSMLSLLKLFISIAGILFVIAGYVWWAAALILLFCIPLFVFSVKGGKINYQTTRDTSHYSRKYWYLDYVLNSRECLNERKLFGYTEKVNKQYADTYQEAFGIETKMHAFWAFKTKISGGLSAIAALLIIITLIQPTLSGTISIGLFISLVNAVFSLTSQMSWGLSRNIDALVKAGEFCRHALTFKENCQIGDPCHPLSEEKMRKLAEQFDMDEVITDLPDGYDTLLGKTREDGVDLSGGQWQKLAMIRALLRPAKVRILDEPTASLDPKTESEIYYLFQQMTEDTLTILISHRLGFAKLANQILVFDNGTICEQGGFEELMEQRGLFYKMYEEQRSWYQ